MYIFISFKSAVLAKKVHLHLHVIDLFIGEEEGEGPGSNSFFCPIFQPNSSFLLLDFQVVHVLTWEWSFGKALDHIALTFLLVACHHYVYMYRQILLSTTIEQKEREGFSFVLSHTCRYE